MSRSVRRAPIPVAVVLSLIAIGAAAPARAEIRRIAIVVGSNQGDASHAPLRFAEQDASKLAAVLGELGGFDPADLILLRAPRLADVRGALDSAAARITRWHADQHGQTILLFYYSGHSDGQVLELGREVLPFAELRRQLSASGADVRLAIVDSCRSGALLALKGGTLGQPFDIRLTDDLGSTGEAFIASSAADEAALESAEIGASFFSHHFVSGLRGAADLSGDGVVTLAEAYQYAFARTLRATSDTVIGPQHPAYDYRLAGRGDLVLTELRHPSASLELPGGFDRVLVVATASQQVVAEIGPRSARRIALAAGDYQLRAWQGTHTFAARLGVARGQSRRVLAADLAPASAAFAAVTRKGDPSQLGGGEPEGALSARAGESACAPRAGGLALAVAVGLSGAAAGNLGAAWLPALRAGVAQRWGALQLGAAVLAGTGRAGATREDRFAVEVGSMWWSDEASRVRAGVGVGVGGGTAVQTADAGTLYWSGIAWFSPTLAIESRIDRRYTVDVRFELPIAMVRRDDRFAVSLLPTAWVGFSRAF